MRKFIVVFMIMTTVLFAACSFSPNVENEISSILSDMYDAEEGYRESQEELRTIEEKEQQLFDETMDLTQEDQTQLQENVAALTELLNERLEKINDEETSIISAKQLMSKFDALEDQLSADEKNEVDKLKTAIMDRYNVHETFIEQYKQLTSLQSELYQLLIEEDVEISVLNDQVEFINEQNESVISIVNEFNEFTIQLNKAREELFAFFEKE